MYYGEIGMYMKQNEFTITDHKQFKLNFKYSINKNTKSEQFYLTAFYVKNKCILNRSKPNNIFISKNASFTDAFSIIINLLEKVEEENKSRIEKNNDLNELDKLNRKIKSNTFFSYAKNKIQTLYSFFHNNKESLKDYSNLYDFFLLKSSVHIYHLDNELFYFYFRTNEYNKHEVYFLSTLLKQDKFKKLLFETHSDAINYFFDDYKLFNFLSKINSIYTNRRETLTLKKMIMEYIDELDTIQSKKLYFIKDIYKKGHED